MNKPHYPVYIISKGRHDVCHTARCFVRDGVDFRLVVEPQEAELYAEEFGKERLLLLPFSNQGMGGMPARNWVWEHSSESGATRHWIFDDNIRYFGRLHRGERIVCNANIAMRVIEDFTDRYENIGISGFNYYMFVTRETKRPFTLNCHVYSALLIHNEMPYRWRLKYNEDTDLCLQVLTGGLCTVLFNAFCVQKIKTMAMKGGNTDDLYKKDGRLIMARTLEEVWPEYVQTKWRFGGPQHVVKDAWKCFKTPLRLRADVNLQELPKVDNYGMKLRQVKEIRSEFLREWAKQEGENLTTRL